MSKHQQYCCGCYFNDPNNEEDYCKECWDCELVENPDNQEQPANYVTMLPYRD